jgi:hypothetical protein
VRDSGGFGHHLHFLGGGRAAGMISQSLLESTGLIIQQRSSAFLLVGSTIFSVPQIIAMWIQARFGETVGLQAIGNGSNWHNWLYGEDW